MKSLKFELYIVVINTSAQLQHRSCFLSPTSMFPWMEQQYKHKYYLPLPTPTTIPTLYSFPNQVKKKLHARGCHRNCRWIIVGWGMKYADIINNRDHKPSLSQSLPHDLSPDFVTMWFLYRPSITRHRAGTELLCQSSVVLFTFRCHVLVR